MDVLEEYLLGSKSYRKLDAMADTPQHSSESNQPISSRYYSVRILHENTQENATFVIDHGGSGTERKADPTHHTPSDI